MILSITAAGQLLPFRTYRVRDGLVSNVITAFCQDREGYMWIGTSEGISVFDGIDIRNYTTRNGLSFPYVNALLESRTHGGGMWIALNGNGVNRFRKGKFESIRVGNTERSNRVNTIAEDAQGALWCGTDEGLFKIRDNRAVEVPVPNSPRVFTKILIDGDTSLWLLASDGLHSLSMRTGAVRRIDTKRFNVNNAQYLIKANDQSIWMITSDSNLVQFRAGRIAASYHCPLAMTFLRQDQLGHYWLGTARELYQCPSSDFNPKIEAANAIPCGCPHRRRLPQP